MSGIRRKTKSIIFKHLLEKNPGLLSMAREIQYLAWKGNMRFRSLSKNRNKSFNEILWVNPANVKYYVGDLPWSRYGMRGKVISGDWDLNVGHFNKWDLYRAFKSRFKDGEEWNQTKFYERIVAQIHNGNVKWGCKSKDEFESRLTMLERLYDEIKQDGYRPQSELRRVGKDHYSWEPNSPFREYDEVTVCIDRLGRILLRDGKHRLSIAKILGIEKIPVAVGLRHKNWVNFKNEIFDWVNDRGGMSYQPFTHPDLASISAHHNDKRFEMIIQHLDFQKGTILDIGAYFGYFCHRFEQVGFKCTAVENHPKNIYFLKKLRDAEERKFQILEKSIFSIKGKIKFKIILALNIFHHFLKTRELFSLLVKLLSRIDAEYMAFEPHLTEDHVMQNAYVNYEPDRFVEFVLENSCFNKSVCLGRFARGRYLYMLSK